MGSRIIAVCDAFDAMVSKRPYRSARTSAAAVSELREKAGAQFDPRVVKAFEAVLRDRVDACVPGTGVPPAVA
jgi:HD-GYP domain-containing protein (c-di-GMP phosphodiesterase class II)